MCLKAIFDAIYVFSFEFDMLEFIHPVGLWTSLTSFYVIKIELHEIRVHQTKIG